MTGLGGGRMLHEVKGITQEWPHLPDWPYENKQKKKTLNFPAYFCSGRQVSMTAPVTGACLSGPHTGVDSGITICSAPP